jgi:hypothetical protein
MLRENPHRSHTATATQKQSVNLVAGFLEK